MEILNSKLVNELAEVKLSAKQLRKDYEENKRGRKLMEEICNVLANKIADDKVKAEALRIESIKMWEEMEEERKMFQIAECWREECSQMKLIEAKLVLEDKYCQMNKLIAELEAFLRSGSCNLGVIELREVEFIRQAAKSINIKEIKEFSYVPSKSNDIYSIFQEVQQIETNQRIAEICRTGVSKILNYSNGSIYSNSHFEEEAGDWESVWYSLEDSDPSVNVPSHWQSARESEQSVEKIPPIDNGNRKFINDIICRQKPTSLKRKYCERRPKLLNSAGQWSSNNSVNPHIIQGIKGCTEWPKHNQKNSFKAKLES
ncbi:hypothetical protein JCGZ_21224 [Jatropha curcas]|uniref:Uncharacterized protein n=2 Tax=Jatropha curcas TaxID=180498 RepID=A0A067JDE3_JATCU|nr:hypothetical protein JCGZ_21224 [Jatropha curcas]